MDSYQRTRAVKFKGKKITIKYADIMEMIIIVSNLEQGINTQGPSPTLENEKHMQDLYTDVIDEALNNIN